MTTHQPKHCPLSSRQTASPCRTALPSPKNFQAAFLTQKCGPWMQNPGRLPARSRQKCIRVLADCVAIGPSICATFLKAQFPLPRSKKNSTGSNLFGTTPAKNPAAKRLGFAGTTASLMQFSPRWPRDWPPINSTHAPSQRPTLQPILPIQRSKNGARTGLPMIPSCRNSTLIYQLLLGRIIR
jgi:hypothetical protein